MDKPVPLIFFQCNRYALLHRAWQFLLGMNKCRIIALPVFLERLMATFFKRARFIAAVSIFKKNYLSTFMKNITQNSLCLMLLQLKVVN